MRIGLDARWIFPEITGIGSYTTELASALAGLEQQHEFILLFDRVEVRERVMSLSPIASNSLFRAELVPWGPCEAWSQVGMPSRLRRLGLDVYHAPNFLIPYMAFPRRRSRPGCVVTLHDLIPLLFPHFTPRALKSRMRPLFRRVLRATARRADVLLVPSRSTRDDVLDHLGLPATEAVKIRVVPEGVHARYRPAPRREDEPPTILYVGRMDPYKNLEVLVRAFARFRRHAPGASATRLRIIGPDDARYPQSRHTAKRLGIGDAMTWEGYASGERLLDAYQQASVLVLASEYEGFGLPVLEAMACGTPVICGTRGSLPEVAGNAALLVEPGNEEALAGAIEQILSSPQKAAGLGRAGIERAAAFRWKHTAAATLDAYQQAFDVLEKRHA